jgi:hypothetical protein
VSEATFQLFFACQACIRISSLFVCFVLYWEPG